MSVTLPMFGFSAARDLSGFPVGAVEDILSELPEAYAYITGGAIGGDALIGNWLAWNKPDAKHIVIVPSNRSAIDPWWDRFNLEAPYVDVYLMPSGTSYRDRNQEILTRSTELIAFPAYREWDVRSKRSGTWMTARIAKKMGLKVTCHIGDDLLE